MKSEKLICNGEFVAPHGVRGEIRLYSYGDEPSQYLAIDKIYLEDGRSFFVDKIKPHKRIYIVKLKEVQSANEAELFRGKKIFIEKDSLPELPEGEYFHFEIIGLSVFHVETGQFIGKVVNIISTGANDVYEVQSGEGKVKLFPAIREVVKKIDIVADRIEILPQKEW